MALKPQELAKLRRIIAIAEKLINGAGSSKRGQTRSTNRIASRGNFRNRPRRTGRELVAFRKLIKSERKKGVPVAALARKHGISAAYIYMIG
jgi:hypothetical protein